MDFIAGSKEISKAVSDKYNIDYYFNGLNMKVLSRFYLMLKMKFIRKTYIN